MEEARTVYGLAGGKSFWLGLRKGKRDWYWDSKTYGTRAHFFFWRTGQPDVTSSKECVYAAYAGEWMTADCDNFRSPKVFICQSKFYELTLKFAMLIGFSGYLPLREKWY
uniref:C-type lectin domain-containing protein n=1 Tax=Elaeophora elaphi TaxID=1147741 RepID=A0A0R3RJ95_9BILA